MALDLDSLKTLVSPILFAQLIGLWVGYRILLALYNISPFHPLSRFPGPKIAAATYLYEAYYDWWLLGRYGKVIQHMHEQYGKRNRLQGCVMNPDQ